MMTTTGSTSTALVKRESPRTVQYGRYINRFVIPMSSVPIKHHDAVAARISKGVAKIAGSCHILSQGIVSYYPGDVAEVSLNLEVPLPSGDEKNWATYNDMKKEVTDIIFRATTCGVINHIRHDGMHITLFNPKNVLT